MRAKGHKEPVGTRGQASQPAPHGTSHQCGRLASHRGTPHSGSAAVGQRPQTPGCPRHPWVGPAPWLPARDVKVQLGQGTPGLPLLPPLPLKQERGEAAWPLGQRRRLGPCTAESHSRPWGPPALRRPVGLRPGKAAWPALPESAHRTGFLNRHRPYGNVQATPTRAVRMQPTKETVWGFHFISFTKGLWGGQRVDQVGGLLSRHRRGPLVSQTEGTRGEYSQPDPSWAAVGLSKAPTPCGRRDHGLPDWPGRQ